MARDVLAVPISGAGVERFFSAARRICSYQRSLLNAEIIKRLILLRFAYEICRDTMVQFTNDDVDEKEREQQKKVETRADFVLAASLDISDNESETEESHNDADNGHGGSAKRGHKRVALQSRGPGR
jgi:hypothetical protein